MAQADGTPVDDDLALDPPRLTRGRLLAWPTRRPVPKSVYPHACRATKPGILPWAAAGLLVAATVAGLAALLGSWAWQPTRTAAVLLAAVAVLWLFLVVAWGWGRPRTRE